MTITRISPQYSVSGPLSEDELNELQHNGVTTFVNVRPDNEVDAQTNHRQWREKVKAMGLEYIFVPVTSGKYSLADITAFYDVVTDPQRKVHGFCRTGTRAVHLWALSLATKQDCQPIQKHCNELGFDLTGIAQQMQFLHDNRPWQGMFI